MIPCHSGQTRDSNLGTGLLGHLLERISGQPYETFVRETIFEPHRGEVGLGWFIGKDGLWHDGGTGGFRSELRLSRPDKTATIRLMNAIGTLSGEETRGEVGELSGYWQGTLDVGAAKLRLLLRISGDGRVILHSLDQGGQGLPADRTFYEDGRFRAIFGGMGARFEGTREGERLTGTWSQNGELPLVLERSPAVPAALKDVLAKTVTGDPAPIDGFWSGYLGGKAGLFVVFEIDTFDGACDARFYSPDESSEPLPVTRLSFEGGQLLIESALIKAAFAARLGDDGRLTGAWKQGPLPVPLSLVRSDTMPKRE